MVTPLLLASCLLAVVVARTDGAYVEPVIAGNWTTSCLNPGISSARIQVTYFLGPISDPTYKLQVDTFLASGACTLTPDLREYFVGTYALWQPPASFGLGGDGNSSTAFVNLTYSSKPIYLLTPAAVAALKIECNSLYNSLGGDGVVQASNQPYESFTVGCPGLGIANKSTCPIEYDIVATFNGGNLISFGNRINNGITHVPCTTSETPTAFGYVASNDNNAVVTPVVTVTPTPSGASLPLQRLPWMSMVAALALSALCATLLF